MNIMFLPDRKSGKSFSLTVYKSSPPLRRPSNIPPPTSTSTFKIFNTVS